MQKQCDRSSFDQSPSGDRRHFHPFAGSALAVIAMTLWLTIGAMAQQPAAPLDSNAATGFESLGTWSVTGSSMPPGFMTISTSQRTQGSAAYQISNPPNMVKVISQPLSSTATALTGIGNYGAVLQVDLFLPVQQGNKTNPGYIQAYITSSSRRLSKVALSQVFFSQYRAGIYNTINFALPDSVVSGLNGSFSDLVVEFDISSPGKVTGAYLLDNLRVHSIGLPQNPTSDTAIPPGYGGSIDLVIFGNQPPVAATFALGPAQIPAGFHLKRGAAGATTVELKLGLDGTPSVTCTYVSDPQDSTGRSYIVDSCTGGFKAGDLVSANWVSLDIVGGDDTQKIRAQIALNPLGDTAGAGLIPPMPTFWGDADECQPAPVAGQVVTVSQSCQDQLAQTNSIITAYFDQVKNSNPPNSWIVAPVPEFAKRLGDPTPLDLSVPGAQVPPNDPPFDFGGHLNSGGSFDAYWRLNGNLTPTDVPNTDQNLTDFEANFGAHGVLFGYDADVVDARLTAHTDSGETTPTYKPAQSTGTVGFYVLGTQVYSNTVNPQTGFSIDATYGPLELNLPTIHIWIFSITAGATGKAELKAAASAAVSGADLSITPSAVLGAHVAGGIDVVIASGTVDAQVELLNLSTPVIAQAKWIVHTQPQLCALTLDGKLKGDVNLSSGGGKIDLKATFGICPFCDTESQTIFKWDSLVSRSWNLFDATIDTQLFQLPVSLCAFPSTATILSPASGASLNSGVPLTFSGSVEPNDNTISVTSRTYNWTFTPGANASTVNVTGGDTAHPVVTFGAPTSGASSSWTIGLSGTVTTKSASGQTITSTAPATSIPVTVTSGNTGTLITSVFATHPSGLGPDGPVFADANGVYVSGFVNTMTVSGTVFNASGTINSTFTIDRCTDSGTYSASCSTSVPLGSLPVSNGGTASPSTAFPWTYGDGAYRITITTTTSSGTYTNSILLSIVSIG